MTESATPLRARALRLAQWVPSAPMLLVLAVWWGWRWACVPASLQSAGVSVAVGFAHDALVLYGLFGMLRWWHGQRSDNRAAPLVVAGLLLALSACARALDALQIRLTDTHLTTELLAVIAADPLAELWGLRGLLLAVAASSLAGLWALHQDRKFWRRLRSMGVAEGFRVDVFAGASLLAGVVLAWGRTGDPASIAPEVACMLAAWAWLTGG